MAWLLNISVISCFAICHFAEFLNLYIIRLIISYAKEELYLKVLDQENHKKVRLPEKNFLIIFHFFE